MVTDDGADGLDPLPLPDDFDDVLPLLNMADFDSAEEQPSRSHNFSANGLLYWPGMAGNYSTVDGTPGVTQPNGLPVHGDPSTSSTAAARHADVLDCNGCQVLREVMHSNGLELTKLRIHGHGAAEGLFYHAMSDVYRINSEGLAAAFVDRSFIDFKGRDYEWVRHYLTNYALQRAAGNYAVVGDSLSPFHDVLCTTMNPGIRGNEQHHHEGAAARNGVDRRRLTVHNAAAIQPAIRRNKEPEPAGPSQLNHTTDVQVQQPLRRVVGRSALALQKERTSKLQFHDIAPYFHLPIVKAAEKLDMCNTVLKRICRRVGVQRLSHRKVKKIDGQITTLRKSGNGAWARDEIERMNSDRKRIFLGPE